MKAPGDRLHRWARGSVMTCSSKRPYRINSHPALPRGYRDDFTIGRERTGPHRPSQPSHKSLAITLSVIDYLAVSRDHVMV